MLQRQCAVYAVNAFLGRRLRVRGSAARDWSDRLANGGRRMFTESAARYPLIDVSPVIYVNCVLSTGSTQPSFPLWSANE